MSIKMEWVPFEEEAPDASFEAGGKTIELDFRQPDLHKELHKIVGEEMQRAFEYFFGIMGSSFPITPRWTIRITEGKQFGALGCVLNFPKYWIEQVKDTSVEKSTQDLVRSLLVHELMHNLSDDEEFSMFAEMIYEAEHGQFDRLDEIQLFYDLRDDPDAELKLGESYVRGIDQIALWMECKPNEVFSRLKEGDTAKWKAVLKTQLEKFCRDEGIIKQAA